MLQERDELKEELQRHIASQQEAEQALEQEKSKRARDRQDFEQRVLEVNQKVSEVVQGLEDKLADSEQRLQAAERSKNAKLKDLERKIETLVAENELLDDRARKAEHALEGTHLEIRVVQQAEVHAQSIVLPEKGTT